MIPGNLARITINAKTLFRLLENLIGILLDCVLGMGMGQMLEHAATPKTAREMNIPFNYANSRQQAAYMR